MASELITIHIRYIDEEGAIIGKDYHFNNDTHKLSHFYSIKNNHLHGFAVFYNDARKADVFANAIKHEHRSKNPTTRWSDIITLK